jgi:hypothetical protein
MTNSVCEWKSVLTLDSERNCVAGNEQDLIAAIRRGADLRIYTEFRNNEHLDTDSDSDELVQEVSEFRVTYLLDDRWAAGIMTLRQPILPPMGFGPRPSMSFFLYNQNGQQAVARPHLDGPPAMGPPGPAAVDDFEAMPKYHQHDNWDAETNAPSHNFVYDFDAYRFCVRDDWREVLAHDADGKVLSGSLGALTAGFRQGAEIKIAIRGLCADLANENAADHEVLVQTGPSYFHTQQELFVAATHPVVRVRPDIPLRYESRGWDFGWLMARTDGFVARSLVNPYSLQFSNTDARHGMRWFVR